MPLHVSSDNLWRALADVASISSGKIWISKTDSLHCLRSTVFVGMPVPEWKRISLQLLALMPSSAEFLLSELKPSLIHFGVPSGDMDEEVWFQM